MPEAVTPRFGDSETANTRLSSTDQVTNAGGLLLQQRGSENRLPCVHLLTSDAHDPDGMGFAGVESSGHDSWGVLIQAKNDTPGEDAGVRHGDLCLTVAVLTQVLPSQNSIGRHHYRFIAPRVLLLSASFRR
jgi:hypothetical protein